MKTRVRPVEIIKPLFVTFLFGESKSLLSFYGRMTHKEFLHGRWLILVFFFLCYSAAATTSHHRWMAAVCNARNGSLSTINPINWSSAKYSANVHPWRHNSTQPALLIKILQIKAEPLGQLDRTLIDISVISFCIQPLLLLHPLITQ